MKLIADIEHFWRFWSVRWHLVAGACTGTLAVYASAKAFGAEVVKHVPQWTLDVLIYGALVCTFAGVLSRGLDQPKLRAGKPDDTDSAGA
jgi:hypothetical protein